MQKIMSSAVVYSIQNIGLRGEIISIETDISNGIHSFSIIGFTNKVVEESKDRVASAIKHSGFLSPKSKNQKIVVSLAPGELKKIGSLFDVPIALSYLLANKDMSFDPEGKIFIGELSLQGGTRAVSGIVSILKYAKENDVKELYIPYANRDIVEFIEENEIEIYTVKTLKELLNHLDGSEILEPSKPEKNSRINLVDEPDFDLTFEDIKEQEIAKRALTIAIAGGHNVAMYGPPGTGKTLLAKASKSLLPELTKEEKLEVSAIHSLTSTKNYIHHLPPFRSPHHTSSYASIIGGGSNLMPGEISLAHRGILFLDEFPEFDRRVIESLREPLEENLITITRVTGSVEYSTSIILMIAFNMCPCGKTGTKQICTCTPSSKINYLKKLSGPIIDRIDIGINVTQFDYEKLNTRKEEKDVCKTLELRRNIKRAREIQNRRYKNENIRLNSEMTPNKIDDYIKTDSETGELLIEIAKQKDFSTRSYHRILKTARTIADLDDGEIDTLQEKHILEAIQYKNISFE